VFQQVIIRKATPEQFEDMINIMKNTNNNIDKDPAVEQILATVRGWCVENNYNCTLL
jgi:hypothetical protein